MRGRQELAVAGICAVLVAAPGLVRAADEDVMPIRSFRYPMELYKDGRIKTQILAKELTADPDSGRVDAVKARVEFYSETGELETVLRLETCRYDKDRNRASTDGSVSMERGGLTVTGRGMEWDAEEQRIRILSRAKVVLSRELRESRWRDGERDARQRTEQGE